MIPQETIEQIRQATDIVQVIGEFLRLKKRGKNYLALCPFHTEKTPSFSVSQDKQIYHCFGCGKGGNAFTFLMEHERMSFVEAIRYLARKANITIREENVSGFKRDLIERISYANQTAIDYFSNTIRLPKYKMVLDDYLKNKRDITEESLETFNLGLAGQEWEGLLKYAQSKDLSPDELTKAGLVIYNENKKSYYDRFRQRLMIPIFNLSGKPIAFGGRTLKKDEPAKYINSPETPLYQKGNVLFGLNLSRDYIRDSGFVYVVEGYFDLIHLWQVGIKNVVASSGTAFTLQQARLLARFAEQVYLFFDSDSAGEKAALRSVDALYDAGLEVKIIQSPIGEDPDSISRKFGIEKVEELRSQAVGFIPFRLKNLNVEQTGIIEKEKLVKEFLTIGNRIGDATRRTLFLTEAADALGIDVTLFRTIKSDAATQSASGSMFSREKNFNAIEADLVSLLFHNPGAMDDIFETISPEDFDSKQLARLYSAIIDQYRTTGKVEARSLMDTAGDTEFSELIAKVASKDWPPDGVESETLTYARHISERKKKLIRFRLKKKLAEAEAKGDREKADSILEELKGFGL